MTNDKLVGKIGRYREQIKILDNQTPQTPQTPLAAWRRLSDYTARVSSDQLIYINHDSKVLEAKQAMMSAFVSYLFEKYKDEFYRFDSFQPLCDTYINSVIGAYDAYTERATEALDENEALKQRIAELERKLSSNERQTKTKRA